MQEIIPFIEKCWSSLSEKHGHQCTFINVDDTSPAHHLTLLMTSDLIVVTCFNTKIAHFIKILREKLGIDTRIFFYLHGLATVALWPLERFGILHLMKSDDLFIGTCNGDIKSLELSFKNASTVKIPFTIMDHSLLERQDAPFPPFVYIGRISPQKNLHFLIEAYSQLDPSIKKAHPLIFYGVEDHLGFPNIGKEEKQYQQKLMGLIEQLNLKNFVHFKGFVERKIIQKELGNHYVFISPSTHSDENFGMAAFRALISGASCILTAWGGHLEFKKHFSKQLIYLTPKLASSGPFISVSELKEAMINSLSIKNQKADCPKEMSFESICLDLNEKIEQAKNHSTPLEPTDLAKSVFLKQKSFESKNQIQRCFESFEDPAFISFFEAYKESSL